MKVSIICACKNRVESLYASIQSWIGKEEVYEIIIVDWTSDKPLHPLVNLSSKVKIIRVDGEKYFNMPQPLNLAASVATGDYILTMATDYVFNPYKDYNFFDIYKIDNESFLCGMSDYESDLRTKEPIFYFLRGILFVSRENFVKVGGYRQTDTKYYGNEDDEIIERLQSIGLERKDINQRYSVFHFPHTDEKRIENFEGYHTDKDLNESVYNQLSYNYSGEQLKWQSIYLISQIHIQKNLENYSNGSESVEVKWEIDQYTDQLYKAKKVFDE
jgi:hypothetical protein